ncbi:Poly(A)+ RNA export protein [Spraguea lophii 42_110]|uniref:Poly(A)+ RNA export protein n=1 Tax=Spraguea lophii (strain 42_110) TaxID=1358809 RepID=S7WCQ1_SPRLO|nr:Poly(A)+ RNA export protein [Spraguea lophii 42_110]
MFGSTTKIINANNNPNDTISDIVFHSSFNYLGVSSWDGSLRIYDSNLDFKLKGEFNAPLLSCSFYEGSLYGASTNGSVCNLDLNSGQLTPTQIKHNDGIRSIRTFQNMLVTGSWDKTIKFWDVRTQQPAHTINLPDRIFVMDLKKELLVASIAGNRLYSFDLKNNCQQSTQTTRLTYQIRALDVGYDNDSFAVGSIDGRCEIISCTSPGRNFSFRGHRSGIDVYSINCINISPASTSKIATGGADSYVVVHDRSTRSKIINENMKEPPTAGIFNQDGSKYVFATGNDWSKGYVMGNIATTLRMVEVRSRY